MRSDPPTRPIQALGRTRNRLQWRKRRRPHTKCNIQLSEDGLRSLRSAGTRPFRKSSGSPRIQRVRRMEHCPRNTKGGSLSTPAPGWFLTLGCFLQVCNYPLAYCDSGPVAPSTGICLFPYPLLRKTDALNFSTYLVWDSLQNCRIAGASFTTATPMTRKMVSRSK